MNIPEITRKYLNAVNPDRLDKTVRELAVFDRVQTSEGLHKAAERAVEILARDGITARIHRYPSDDGVFYGPISTMGRRFVREAWCELEEEDGRRIADYAASSWGLMESVGYAFFNGGRGGFCKRTEEPVEFIYMDRGGEESAYADVDFSGKAVFFDDTLDHRRCKWLYERKILCIVQAQRGYNGRKILPSPEKRAVLDKLIGWSATDFSDGPTFLVNYEECERIKRLFWRLKRQGKVPHVRCCADIDLGPDTIDTVEAFLPGETDEEVVVAAHLCHPQNSCNDNLSGVASAIELMRATKRMLERGDIPPLKRGIRMLFGGECISTHMYLEEIGASGRKKILAGIDMDMVGASQNGQNAPLNLNETPHAMPSFTGMLGALVLNEFKEEERITGRYGCVPLIRTHVMEFRGGSDHGEFTDAVCGIPMPMLGQEPDRFFHSDQDKPETLDMFVLRRSCAFCGAFLETLSNLTEDNVKEIIPAVSERMVDRIHFCGKKTRLGELREDWFPAHVREFYTFYTDGLDDMLRYFEGDALERVKAIIAGEKQTMKREALMAAERAIGYAVEFPAMRLTGGKWDRKPRKTWFGESEDLYSYVQHLGDADKTAALNAYEEDPANRLWSHEGHQFQYFMDGTHTLGEIVERTRLECYEKGTDEALVNMADMLDKLGLIEWQD